MYSFFLSQYNEQALNPFENITSNALPEPQTPLKKIPLIEEPGEFTTEELEDLADEIELEDDPSQLLQNHIKELETEKNILKEEAMQNVISSLQNPISNLQSVQSSNEQNISSLKIGIDEKEPLTNKKFLLKVMTILLKVEEEYFWSKNTVTSMIGNKLRKFNDQEVSIENIQDIQRESEAIILCYDPSI